MQPLGTKNHATSRDQKITQTLMTQKNMQPFGTKKNHKISWDKKVMQPLGTKKNSATSWDKKKT